MNFSIPFDEVCETSMQLYHEHSYMRGVFIAEFVIGIIAIISATLLMLAIFFNKTLHFNVRVLFICFCAALLVANIGIVLSSMYYLLSIAYRPSEERCQWLTFTKSDCIGDVAMRTLCFRIAAENTSKNDYSVADKNALTALRNVCNLGTAVIVVSALFLSIERIIATLLYRTYEQQRRRWIGLLLGGSQWALIIPLLLLQKSGNEMVLPYCAAELYGPTLAKNTEYVLIVAEGCALLIFVVLWNHNHKKSVNERPHEQTLNVRYQVRENVATTKLMVPIMLHNCLFISTLAVLYELFLPVQDYYTKADDYLRDVSRYAIYAELQSSLLPLTTILLMYIVGCFNSHIRLSFARLLRLDRCLSKNANIVDVTSEEHARQLYFDRLQQQWNNFTDDICSQR